MALDPEQKASKRAQVTKLAHDMVIIKHPFQLAWQLELEWQDPDDLSLLDRNTMMEYILFFPASGMANILRGYLGLTEVKTTVNGHVDVDRKVDEEEKKEEETKWKQLNADNRLLAMLDGLNDTKELSLIHI